MVWIGLYFSVRAWCQQGDAGYIGDPLRVHEYPTRESIVMSLLDAGRDQFLFLLEPQHGKDVGFQS